jgi:hypothetical protein
MRIEKQDKQQLEIAIHPEEASFLLTELKEHAELMDGEADDLIEALESAGVEPYQFPENYRLEFPQNWQHLRRAKPEDVTLARQEIVGM